jgi:hypothetical protein
MVCFMVVMVRGGNVTKKFELEYAPSVAPDGIIRLLITIHSDVCCVRAAGKVCSCCARLIFVWRVIVVQNLRHGEVRLFGLKHDTKRL